MMMNRTIWQDDDWIRRLLFGILLLFLDCGLRAAAAAAAAGHLFGVFVGRLECGRRRRILGVASFVFIQLDDETAGNGTPASRASVNTKQRRTQTRRSLFISHML